MVIIAPFAKFPNYTAHLLFPQRNPAGQVKGDLSTVYERVILKMHVTRELLLLYLRGRNLK